MKKVFYVIGIIIFLAICYIFVNFFYFDSWACHSSEKQLNNYVKHEDCLLYTSPSPRDRQKSRMPSSA